MESRFAAYTSGNEVWLSIQNSEPQAEVSYRTVGHIFLSRFVRRNALAGLRLSLAWSRMMLRCMPLSVASKFVSLSIKVETPE